MRGRAGLVPEISVSGLKILPYEHFLILIILSMPFNCSDTALRVTDAKIGRK